MKMKDLFDIPAEINLNMVWQKKTCVKNEREFYDKQKLIPPLGYSTSKFDKRWGKNAKRKIVRTKKKKIKKKIYKKKKYKKKKITKKS